MNFKNRHQIQNVNNIVQVYYMIYIQIVLIVDLYYVKKIINKNIVHHVVFYQIKMLLLKEYFNFIQLNERQQKRIYEGEEEAVDLKNRLLQYDREQIDRARVFDDQTDYFSMAYDNWATEEERQEALKKAKPKKTKKIITLDINTKKFKEIEVTDDEDSDIDEREEQINYAINAEMDNRAKKSNTNIFSV